MSENPAIAGLSLAGFRMLPDSAIFAGTSGTAGHPVHP